MKDNTFASFVMLFAILAIAFLIVLNYPQHKTFMFKIENAPVISGYTIVGDIAMKNVDGYATVIGHDQYVKVIGLCEKLNYNITFNPNKVTVWKSLAIIFGYITLFMLVIAILVSVYRE